ncbi:type II toxin-antitoxin system RelE/ParE family toxin [Neisseria weixii]|uniref:type II toxin-antitoxin system RelE/ParE family toxin n=1 Tax=Neisseria weixii TaxID=1853276 RepID=UPI000BB88557|nr:type II toxin-antitoxin system RelE/ParE family toxin [Neisseria weixii]ATD64619.1 addiction module toxin RelE [Neisseria weixii]
MPQVMLTEHATADLRRLYDFLALKNEQAARNAVKAVRDALAGLAQFPAAGRFFDDEYREWPVSFGDAGYTILYRIDPETVVIVAIKHQSGIELQFSG